MIQVYKAGNENFDKNGDMVLTPTECTVKPSINSDWPLSITHPVDDDGRYTYIKEGAVLKVPSFNGDQLFRIYDKELTLDDVTALASPIFMDSEDEIFLMDVRPTDKTGQQALDIMLAGQSKFSATSDISTSDTAYYIRKNFIEALNGDDDNSFTNRWGGEIYFNNYNLIVNAKLGSDRGVSIRYGKNIVSIKEKVNLDKVMTRAVPIAYNGYTLDGSTPWVDSPNISKYPKIFTKTVTYGDVKFIEDASGDETGYSLPDLRTELTRRANLEFSSNGADAPSIVLDIDMATLRETDEYEGYEALETIGLGDTVHCIHNEYGIDTAARVIAMEYDCILDEIRTVTIGDVETNYFNNISSVYRKADSAIRNDGTVRAEMIQGLVDSLYTRIRGQRNAEHPSEYKAILYEDRVKESKSFGAVSIGTCGLFISNKRNEADTDWVWSTAITAGSVIADAIMTGKLVGLAFDLNLDTGQILMGLRDDKGDISDPVFKVVIKTAEDGTKTADLYINGNGTFSGDLTAKTIATASGKFSVDSNGIMKAVDANFSGDITANSIATASGKFSVGTDGVVHATDAQLTSASSTDGAYHRGTYNAGTYNSSTDNNGAYNSGSYNYGSLNGTDGFYTGDVSNGSGYNVDISGGSMKLNYNGVACGVVSPNSAGFMVLSADTAIVLSVGGSTAVMNSDGFKVGGAKPRVIDTKDYGFVTTYAYEMAGAMFGDAGEGVIAEDGRCFVDIDPVLMEALHDDTHYLVSIQSYDGADRIGSIERYSGYFIVHGTPKTVFGWEIKAKQRDEVTTRLEPEPDFHRVTEPDIHYPDDTDYEARAEAYLQDYERNILQ